MANNISGHIETINESLAWIKNNKPEQYDQRFLQLVEERRKLRKMANTQKENPAIAAFGESQKGKSYLIGNLLQKDQAPFMVSVRETGKDINFVQSINPIGDKKEATGVVTRFTSFKNQDGRYDAQHPVVVKLFSVANIATILCDSYFLDLLDKRMYSDDEIEAFAADIYQKYRNRSDIPGTPLVEDDILDIKDYLDKFVPDTRAFHRKGFFDKLALVVRKIPHSEWIDVLKYLWHENAIVSSLFLRLTDALRKLNYASEVYVPIEAVLHHGDNKNTIMSVDCLNGLDDATWEKVTDVYLKDANGQVIRVPAFNKSEMCAICAETIFKIEEEYLHDQMSYFYDNVHNQKAGYMPIQTKNKLSASVTKDLLADSDLLDFPGARNRLKIKEEFLDKKSEEDGTSNAVQMLLRGKVAFLFNHYSESHIINILLFCHDNEQPAVNEMYNMLNDWVTKYVGSNAEARRETIQKYGNVSPLFVIGTKFNVDMIQKDNSEHNSRLALDQRWEGRFIKILYTQIFKADSVDWFKNWDTRGNTFKYCYMLRDYKYSGCTGSGNNLYEGYNEADAKPRETRLKLDPAFYNKLRTSFIESPHVRRFFADPEKAWDVAATINNDGALYIIEQLSIVAHNANQARASQFEKDERDIMSKVKSIMSGYHIPEDSDALLEDNIRKANSVVRELDFTCNDDNYYFGHLLQALQLTESECLKEVHRLIQGTELNETTNSFSNYEIIKKRCGEQFKLCQNDSERWRCLMDAYAFASQEEASSYLERRNVDVKILFSGEYKKRLNSCIIADCVFQLWDKKIHSEETMNTFTGEQSFDSVVMSTLLDNLVATGKAERVTDKLSDIIADYVNVVNTSTINESLVADILASTISDFVSDCGFSILGPKDIEKVRKLATSRKLPIFKYIDRERKSFYEEQELTELFNEMTSNPQAITPAFESNYNQWIEYMYISFVAHIDIPDFDPEANKALSILLKKID